jgi:type IV secretory pathway protease TraF
LKCRANGWIFAVIGLVAAAVIPESPCPRLVYNPSRSVAVGFYWITPTAGPRVGELVLMQTPASVAELADIRRLQRRTRAF